MMYHAVAFNGFWYATHLSLYFQVRLMSGQIVDYKAPAKWIGWPANALKWVSDWYEWDGVIAIGLDHHFSVTCTKLCSSWFLSQNKDQDL